ncbi:pyridoxamine 5'-phosphate oxidase family protein [Cetobacterium sp. 8H]|uniref:pyridoxamine 5'-phosphate oxidase family protein n=1 Tax=Cetobacterium sp. 8H TaxID=2759681 RepID=UPI00163C52BC|nr:pyridoxamine 5'-phosphate oxidase family protein [Cetobacterium sp. 8H]MBC2851553.1 pyridoxamine 5'-phosphate oxidase family protein [Cetobacterium sp. 8H]
MMRAKKDFNPEEIMSEIKEFKDNFKNVILGTLSLNDEINVTNAAYLSYNEENYIFVSEIGDHYQNLINKNQTFEVMFIEDESEAANPLARKRLRYKANSEFLKRDYEFEVILDEFEKKLGPAIKVIRKMEDFHLVKLNLLEGRFVKGFGQAYQVKNNQIFQMTGDKK